MIFFYSGGWWRLILIHFLQGEKGRKTGSSTANFVEKTSNIQQITPIVPFLLLFGMALCIKPPSK